MSDIQFDSESGISKEDQKDVIQEIEDVVTKNRIVTTDEDFIVKANKRGVLFPVLVVVCAVAALGIGGAAFYFLFQRGESQIVRGAVGTITAEGQLIQAVRREANGKILEKNQEINTIQGRLADIDKQRQDLQANMDTKVSQKEQELRAQMTTALEAERQRLQKEGLSKQAVAVRMQQLEAQRASQLQHAMEAFKKDADAARLQAEQNLKTMQAEFSANLNKANTERQQAIQDAQKREQDLKGQFAQKTQSLEATSAQATQALNALVAQREKEDLVTGQLVGLYTGVRDQIAQAQYTQALTSLQALRAFVNRTDVQTLPALAKRHDVDLFVIDSLTNLVQTEIEKAKSDTATLLEAANEITELKQNVTDAQAALKAGKVAEAEKAFADALESIPEIAASYAYFVNRDKEAEAARQERLTQALEKADAAAKAENYTLAAADYRTALVYLPSSSDRLDRIVANIEQAGNLEGFQRLSQSQSNSAAALLTQADALRSQGKYDDALSGYMNLIAQYRYSTQVKDALAGIQAATKGLNDNATAAATAKVKDDIAKLQGQIDAMKTDLQKQTTLASAGAIAETQLKNLQDQFAAMQKSYKDYTAKEDAVLKDPKVKARGDAALMDTKPFLDTFFRSAAVKQVFPDLTDRVKKYDLGFQSAGRSDAIQDAISVVINFAQKTTQAQ
ncbi:MAG TPA: hypothetical protein VFB30_21085, partial [Spirochaetia bacterium]|nr:hypothetical protein [Spirochaetia bacterium]